MISFYQEEMLQNYISTHIIYGEIIWNERMYVHLSLNSYHRRFMER